MFTHAGERLKVVVALIHIYVEDTWKESVVSFNKVMDG